MVFSSSSKDPGFGYAVEVEGFVQFSRAVDTSEGRVGASMLSITLGARVCFGEVGAGAVASG